MKKTSKVAVTRLLLLLCAGASLQACLGRFAKNKKQDVPETNVTASSQDGCAADGRCTGAQTTTAAQDSAKGCSLESADARLVSSLVQNFSESLKPRLLDRVCVTCHASQGMAESSLFVLQDKNDPATLKSNTSLLWGLAMRFDKGVSYLRAKPMHVTSHGGGQVVLPGSDEDKALATFVQLSTEVRATCKSDDSVSLPPLGAGGQVAQPAQPAPTRIKRLAHFELDNALEDIFGVTSKPSRRLPPDEESLGFTNGQGLAPTQAFLDQWQAITEPLVETYASGFEVISEPGCAPGEAACAEALIKRFGRKILRRPASQEEVNELLGVFAAGKNAGGGEFKAGLKYALWAMLQAPSFLYRTELGRGQSPDTLLPGALASLSGFELASLLSFSLTGFPPDEELSKAAEEGRLLSQNDVDLHVKRLSLTPRARRYFVQFVFDWLHLDGIDGLGKNAQSVPLWSPELRESLRFESEAFVTSVMQNHNGSLAALLTNSEAMLNASLSTYYGVPRPSTGTGFGYENTSLNANERAGILTRGAFLAAHARSAASSPVQRGQVILERFFCQSLPPPPPDIPVIPDEGQTAGTTRDKYAQHSSQAACAGCHARMDPFGFGLEHYDAGGVFRVRENNILVDAASAVKVGSDVDGSFDGGVELSSKLASSKTVASCFNRQMFRFVTGRIETSADAAPLEAALHALNTSALSMSRALETLVRQPEFRIRTVVKE